MDLQPFNFRGHDVRVIVITEGEPQWVGKDVCEVLEIKNHRDALSRLDPEGVGITRRPYARRITEDENSKRVRVV